MLAAFRSLKEAGVEVVIFGDIYLEDLRAYRDRLLEPVGLAGCYPLWGRNTSELYDDFVGLGFRAVTVCVDAQRLPAGCCGKPLDAAFSGRPTPSHHMCDKVGGAVGELADRCRQGDRVCEHGPLLCFC